MAEKDYWYWEQFDVEQKGGEFDLSDTRTTWLDQQTDVSRDLANEIETQFIDELYGTSEGQTIIDGENKELSREQWTSTYYDDDGAIQREDVSAIWGLDLRRTMQDEDGDTITASHPEFYEHMTRGKVDWDAYEDDSAWTAAARELGESISDLSDDDVPNFKKVELIRRVDASLGTTKKDEDEEKSHLDWEKYDKDKIYRDDAGDLWMKDDDGKPQKQQTLKELYAGDEGRLTVNAPGEHTTIMDRRKVGRPLIPGITWKSTGKGWDAPSLTNKAKIKIPQNVKGLLKGGKK